jgi:hypothetical protein
VKLRRAMFLVIDAKAGISGNWVNTVEGPTGVDMLKAAVDTTMDASVGASYSAFDRTMKDWQAAMIKWRCGLSGAERARLGARPGWNCKDLKGPQLLHRPARLRPARHHPRRRPRGSADPFPAAAAAGRRRHRRRPRDAAHQPDLPGLCPRDVRPSIMPQGVFPEPLAE